jgi:EAL domain-containing protein (putative c-di-GMP-specific phosphodiesterase class I)
VPPPPPPAAGAAPPDIAQIVRERLVSAEFQPIVRIDSGAAVGVEAYGRPPAGSYATPGDMFKAAAAAGLAAELDNVIHAVAYRAAMQANFHPSQSLFINADVTTLSRAVPPDLASTFALAVARLRLFVDVSERDISRHPAAAFEALGRLRQASLGVSWDNAGTTPDSLALMPLVRPDVVKLDVSLIQDRTHPYAAQVVNAVFAYAERAGASIMAVGVETEQHVAIARGMGAVLAQGYRFGRPGPLGGGEQPATVPVGLIAQPAADERHETPYGIYCHSHTTMPATMAMLEAFAIHLEQRCAIDAEPPVILMCVPEPRLPSGAALDRLALIARNSSFTAVLAAQAPTHPIGTVRVSTLAPDDPIVGEWTLVVVGPFFAALLTARSHPSRKDDLLDLGLTFRRATVLRAAQSLLSRIAAD